MRLIYWAVRLLDNYLSRRGYWVQVYVTTPEPVAPAYVGSLSDGLFLARRGIRAERREPHHTTVSVGFSEREQKWYGWSHRAICGFGIGDRIENNSHVCAETLSVGFQAKTLEDARVMACAFAESVS